MRMRIKARSSRSKIRWPQKSCKNNFYIGIKILDGSVTDSVEAEAFRHECEEVDIYSMSWGPSDDGMTFGGFMKLSYEAIDYCIKHVSFKATFSYILKLRQFTSKI